MVQYYYNGAFTRHASIGSQEEIDVLVRAVKEREVTLGTGQTQPN